MGECSRDLAQTSKSFCCKSYMDTISSVAVNDQDIYKMSLAREAHEYDSPEFLQEAGHTGTFLPSDQPGN